MDSVWHYTTAAGLEGIITSNVLRATSYRFMNDSQEPTHATSLLEEAAKLIRSSLNPAQAERFDELMKFAKRRGLEAFLLCAAREPDLLTVWRGYELDVPYAIELDASADLFPVEQRPDDSHPSPPAGWGREVYDEDDGGRPILGPDPDDIRIETSAGWQPVQYDGSTAAERVERIAWLARKDPEPLADALLPYSNLGGIDLLQPKHSAFVDEREARIVFDVYPRWKFVKHRPGRFGLIPYIEISAAEKSNQNSANERFVTKPASKLPILAVHIGPSPLGEEFVDALREFLEFNAYPDVPIEKSATPFR